MYFAHSIAKPVDVTATLHPESTKIMLSVFNAQITAPYYYLHNAIIYMTSN